MTWASALNSGMSGDPAEQLHERHDASDFATKTQDKLKAPA